MPIMFRHRRQASLAALMYAIAAAPAAAQQSSPPAEPPPATGAQPAPAAVVEGVTVTARAPTSQTTLDAKSYSLGANLKTDTGSLADVLRDLPSVSVDIEGNVSLRGDSDVTILVDGKPSALFTGPGRAQAIQNTPASQFERVEVMTNPSASQTAEGSGGVINLVSKRPPARGAAPAASGTVKAQIGTGDRFEVGGTGAYTSGALSATGGANYRQDAFSRSIGTRYGIPDPTTGALDPAQQVQDQKDREDDLNLNGAVGYQLDPRDHIDASVTAEVDRETLDQAVAYQTAATSGPLALNYFGPSSLQQTYRSASQSVGITHTLPGDGQSLSAKLSLSQGRYDGANAADYSYVFPAQPDLYQDMATHADFDQLDLKVDYKATLPRKAKLALGYEGRFDWQTFSQQGVDGVSAATATTDPAFAEQFRFDQQVHALYATYEQAVGRLTAQAGLRVEATTLQTDLVSAGEAGRQAYVKAFPSLHLDYALSDTSDIRASYGRRVQRPYGGRLDPFRMENSPTLYSAGNPDLAPAITQSWELSYEYRRRTTDFQATLFYRDKSDVFTTVQNDIGGDVLLSTWANIGRIRDAGFELVFNHEILRHVTVNTSADFRRSEVDAGNIGPVSLTGGPRTAYISAGHATIDWQATGTDFLQIGAQASGRELTAQGYVGGSIFSDLGWRHRFGPRLSALLTAQDPFGMSRRTIATYTPELVDVQKRKFNYTAVFFSLSYALGGAPKTPSDNFDFGTKQGGP